MIDSTDFSQLCLFRYPDRETMEERLTRAMEERCVARLEADLGGLSLTFVLVARASQ